MRSTEFLIIQDYFQVLLSNDSKLHYMLILKVIQINVFPVR